MRLSRTASSAAERDVAERKAGIRRADAGLTALLAATGVSAWQLPFLRRRHVPQGAERPEGRRAAPSGCRRVRRRSDSTTHGRCERGALGDVGPWGDSTSGRFHVVRRPRWSQRFCFYAKEQ
jgi:hypothetical protein